MTTGEHAYARRTAGCCREELAVTTATIYPVGLAGLVRELADGRIPTEPVRLPWHH